MLNRTGCYSIFTSFYHWQEMMTDIEVGQQQKTKLHTFFLRINTYKKLVFHFFQFYIPAYLKVI